MVVDMGRDGRQDTVELVYRPTHTDFLAGVRLRERRRRLHLLRWTFTGVLGVTAAASMTVPESAVAASVIAFCAAGIWALPHYQAHHGMRTVSWQGEYRASVSETGITVETAHATLFQRWSVFRGFRETRDHVIFLSRDPNILLVEVLPKRGLHSPQEVEQLRAVVSRHLPCA